MKSILCLVVTASLLGPSLPSRAQTNCAPLPLTQHVYGGDGTDLAIQLLRTSNDGYLLAGYSSSPIGGTKTTDNYGSFDYWVVRVGPTGDVLWDNTYGGYANDTLNTVVPTLDGGYLLVGTSFSPPSGNKTSPSYDSLNAGDYWLVKIDAAGGKIWDHSYGGIGPDIGMAALALPDGSFIVGGFSFSETSGNKLTELYGSSDYWVLRIDAAGAIIWQRTFGGTERDELKTMRLTAANQVILGGSSASDASGNKLQPGFGGRDLWLVVMDLDGNKLEEHSHGGSYDDVFGDVVQTADGGYVVGASSYSRNDGSKTSTPFGGNDYWITRFDTNWTVVWDRMYGGTSEETLHSLLALPDGGFAFGGHSYSYNNRNKTARNQGSFDAWIIRTDSNGNPLWDESLGGVDTEGSAGMGLALNGSGRLVVATESASDRSGNKTVTNIYSQDFWLVSLADESDCDGDSVPNGFDNCAGTAVGMLVDSSGCSLDQHCPCEGPFTTHAAYVDCVTQTVSNFVQAGLLTAGDGELRVTQAQASDCPMIPGAVVAFGLTNALLGEAYLINQSGGDGQLLVVASDYQGADGLAIYTGEAESGVFIVPTANVWGSYDEAWFMEEHTYGSVDGQVNRPIGSIRATKPYYENYPVDFDFSALNPASLTVQYFNFGMLTHESTTEGGRLSLCFCSSANLGPRVNPFWRMPDGSVGALVELTEANNADIVASVTSSTGEVPLGDRVFVRVNNPTSRVDFVSRADIFIGGGLDRFGIADERLGVFQKAHRAIGNVTMHAKTNRLTVRMLPDNDNSAGGVLMEIPDATYSKVEVEPIVLAPEVVFDLVLVGGTDEGYDSVANAHLETIQEGLQLRGGFSALQGNDGTNTTSDPVYAVHVYRDGSLRGTFTITNMLGVSVEPVDTNLPPAVVETTVTLIPVTQIPMLAVTFQNLTRFSVPSETPVEGTEARLLPVGSMHAVHRFTTLSLQTTEVQSFSITDEATEYGPPMLSVERQPSLFLLSWPVRSQRFVLESSATPDGIFVPVPIEPVVTEAGSSVSVPMTNSSQFFRLRQTPQ